MTEKATLVEVGPRDGFQSIGPFIETATKVAIIGKLYQAGVRRVEATSFASPSAVPQLADCEAVLTALRAMPELDCQVLVPTARYADRALSAGARHIAFVLSVSERHNQANVRRSPVESVREYARIAEMVPLEFAIRLNVATAFDCPFTGAIDPATTLELLQGLVDVCPRAEIALCDTTGRVTPDRVGRLFAAAMERFPQAGAWAFHSHDTYGQGAANVISAWNAGIRVFDSAIAGLGGCPFAPGATGNVATEDLVWMFERMGTGCGIDLMPLIALAQEVANLPGAQTGGRVRCALAASGRR